MPKEIWNEGRVVGLSAYEVYVKHHLTEDLVTPPASEREWLASSLAMGSSLLLRVPDVDQGAKDHTYVDIYLPSDSRLAAANTIIAQFFDGEAEFDLDSDINSEKCWATRVTDYGQIISNTSENSPSGTVGPDGVIPAQILSDLSDTKKRQLNDYMKVIDGLVIQPGEWVDSAIKPPEKDFKADLSNPYPRIRLHVRGNISSKPLILLTGFTIRTILSGTVGADSVIESASPQDGDFLGPAVFPWAAKIVFSVPTSFISYFLSGSYIRTLESPTAAGDLEQKLIQDTPVIDMGSTKPETYYSDYQTSEYSKYSPEPGDPRHAYQVDDFATTGEGDAVLTVYQRSEAFPPALYGTFVSLTGQNYLNPIDTVAPGTVKMFYNDDGTLINLYQSTFPGTTGMTKNEDGTVQIVNNDGDLISISDIELDYMNTDRTSGEAENTFASPEGDLSGSNRPRIVKLSSGSKSGYAVMLSEGVSTDPSLPTERLPISKIPNSAIELNESNSGDNITWAAMLPALDDNKGVDLLGSRLKSVKYTLQKPITGNVPEGASDKKDITKGNAYIEFGPENNAIRLYISKEMPDPTNVPIGSIGIGWGFDGNS